MKDKFYDPRARAAEKQQARDRDAADLSSGRVSKAEIQDRNRFLKGINPAEGKIRDWKEMS